MLAHDLLRFGRVLILVALEGFAPHGVGDSRIARIVPVPAGLAIRISLVNHPDELAPFDHGPGVCVRGAHAIARGFDGIARMKRSRFIDDNFFEGFACGF